MSAVEKLKHYGELFDQAVREKQWEKGKYLYDTARTVVVFLELDEQTKAEIMEKFDSDRVQRCYLEVSIKRKQDPMYHPEVLAKK